MHIYFALLAVFVFTNAMSVLSHVSIHYGS